MTKTETKTTYWCDGCAQQVKEKKDLFLFQKDNSEVELCSKCIQYIIDNATWFIPRLKCTKCNGTGFNYSSEMEINWHDDKKPYFTFVNNNHCPCGRH